MPEIPERGLITIRTTPTSITIIIRVPACGARNGRITRFSYILFELSLVKRSTAGVEIRRGTIDVANDETVSSEILEDLNPCSTYEVRVAAGTDVGYGEYASSIVTTEEVGMKLLDKLN